MSEGIPPEIAEDLFEYPLKRRSFAYILWGFLGIVGGHRLYLNRVWTGIAMLLTFGGVLIWWIVDFFLIPRMVFQHNTLQGQRRDLGLPPVGLDFLPASDGSELMRPPPWHDPRSRKGLRGVRKLLTDALVLVVAGSALGMLSRVSGNIEAVAAVFALVVVLNLGRQMSHLHQVPLVGDLVRWSYRLRLFYHHVKPGNAFARLFRPAVGIFYAPFRKKSRAEVGLYLRLGGAFVVLFLLEDLATEVVQPFVTQASLAGLTGVWWVKDVVLTLTYIFAFTAPIGATLMIYLLTRRSHFQLAVLSALTLGAVAFGLMGCEREPAALVSDERLLEFERASLDRQLSSEASTLAEAFEQGDVLVSVSEELVRKLLAAALPLETDIPGGIRISATDVQVDFRPGLALLEFSGRASPKAMADVQADLSILASLEILDLMPGDAYLRARLSVLGFRTTEVAVGSLRPPVEELLNDLAERRLIAFAQLFGDLEIPIRLDERVELPSVDTPDVTIQAASLDLSSQIFGVYVGEERIWVAIELALSPEGVPESDAQVGTRGRG